MRLVMLALAAAGISMATAASAQEGTPEVAKKDPMVCKSARFAGSSISQRICKPKSEWEAARKNAQRALETKDTRDFLPKPAAGG